MEWYKMHFPSILGKRIFLKGLNRLACVMITSWGTVGWFWGEKWYYWKVIVWKGLQMDPWLRLLWKGMDDAQEMPRCVVGRKDKWGVTVGGNGEAFRWGWDGQMERCWPFPGRWSEDPLQGVLSNLRRSLAVLFILWLFCSLDGG